jgi:hypothetical protein
VVSDHGEAVKTGDKNETGNTTGAIPVPASLPEPPELFQDFDGNSRHVQDKFVWERFTLLERDCFACARNDSKGAASCHCEERQRRSNPNLYFGALSMSKHDNNELI